ncbi:uncharacterized protein F5147DRAFT_768357 [Suillus discolor]|uniref:Uncharacterized protein n=1 Tax=Suillus discolor TaxID=1912936 RepID=A0A9P7FJ57_9AGAM|nr:uncharacterized protein F5147DRAFT_768357 [Suillus discolor]KAG2118223.1 hypothetical protein F5147DRAFT_768357 [Suillus discolor]
MLRIGSLCETTDWAGSLIRQTYSFLCTSVEMPALNLETPSLALTPRSFVCKFNSVRHELSIPDGYSADGLGNLLADNESESYERAPDDTEPEFTAMTTDGSKEVDVEGRGKRRRVANTQYKDFWQH